MDYSCVVYKSERFVVCLARRRLKRNQHNGVRNTKYRTTEQINQFHFYVAVFPFYVSLSRSFTLFLFPPSVMNQFDLLERHVADSWTRQPTTVYVSMHQMSGLKSTIHTQTRQNTTHKPDRTAAQALLSQTRTLVISVMLTARTAHC